MNDKQKTADTNIQAVRKGLTRKMPAPKIALELIDRFERNLDAYRSGHEQTALQRQIDTTGGQIDKLVYELYGLKEREVAIAERG